VRVILTAGVLEVLDEVQAQHAEADGTLKKPFEASALLSAVKPLAEAAAQAREEFGAEQPSGPGKAKPAPANPFVAVVDAEQVKAAVTVALDGAMDDLVEEISRRVVAALQSKKPEAVVTAATAPQVPVPTPAALEPPKPAIPPPAAPHGDVVRRVSPLRFRSGSILGLEIGKPETDPEGPPSSLPLPPPDSL
jgi:hypothetical protein